jgi:hypothetical protein
MVTAFSVALRDGCVRYPGIARTNAADTASRLVFM